LIPRSRVLHEKLTSPHPVKKFAEVYVTKKFITAITSARHLYLSWAKTIQSSQTHPTSWGYILILSDSFIGN
jgi:hypothetical protein